MHIFVHEYVCGGGLAGCPLPESLAQEGWAMFASVVEDLAAIEGIVVTATLDERLGNGRLNSCLEFTAETKPSRNRQITGPCIRRVSRTVTERSTNNPNITSSPALDFELVGPGTEPEMVRRLANAADWTLLIAPEFDGILLERVRWVEQAGGHLLGPSASAVEIAADKVACAQLLTENGVPVVEGRMVRLSDEFPHDTLYPAVLKPRDGAGSCSTFLVPNATSVAAVISQADEEGLNGEVLLQRFVPGLSASVAFLVDVDDVTPLLAAEQYISNDGRFRYLGGRVPLDQELAGRAIDLGRKAVLAMPGLRGYVGVDLIIQDRPDMVTNTQSFADYVLEINPRLTTSYVGYRSLAADNLAEHLVRACSGDRAGPIRWNPGTVRFRADGSIT